MKALRITLWVLFPISLIAVFFASYFSWITSARVGNILLTCSLLLPVTAMAVQTLENKDKNLSRNHFIIKVAFVLYLYLMIAVLFAITARRLSL